MIARRSESPDLIAMRFLLTLPLFLSLLIWLVRPGLLDWSRMSLPSWARWAGAAVGTACIPLILRVMRSIGSNVSETVLTKAGHTLIAHGPYRRVRQPLYTTGLLLLLSATLLSASWLIGTLTAAAALAIRFVVIPREESALTARFGDAYTTYAARTGRLLPARAAARHR